MGDLAASRRVVVTGMGVVTPIGKTVGDFWASVKEGKSAIAPIERFFQNDPHFLKLPSDIPNFDLDVRIAAQITDFNYKARLRHFKRDKLILFADRYTLFAAAAADEALKQAGLAHPLADPNRAACIIGSAEAGVTNLEISYRHIFELKQPSTHPLTLVRFIGSSAASHIGIEWGVKGPTFGACGACSSAGNAIDLGRNLIRQGQVDVAIVGASESPHTYGTMREWQATGLLSPDGMFPFSGRRNGMVLGEGAGVLVLESLAHARARGAKVLAELCGLATTADCTDMLAPDVDGASEAVRQALEDARLAPGDIDYVNAHGIATLQHDRVETSAIKKAFGAHAARLAVSSTKPLYGHPLGASGAIEAVICIKAMEEGWVPPTLGLDEADADCDLDYVARSGRQRSVGYTMSNCLGFSGLNSALVFGPPPA